MNDLKIQGTSTLSNKEMKTIEGGLMIGLAICLFALGMSVGIGIGISVKRR